MKTRRSYPWISRLAAFLIRAWGSTLRMEIDDPQGVLGKPGPWLFCFWHNRILMMPYFYKKFWPHSRSVVMVSRSGDGQLIAEILDRFDMETARGSTSKAGAAAYRQVVDLVQKQQYDVGITPDGPRGPRYKLQPGILNLSQLTGAPIVPLVTEYARKIELRSWDRFQIPLPWTTWKLRVATPLQVPCNAPAEELQTYAKRLTEALG